MYNDKNYKFPELKFLLVQNLGPSIYVGYEMTSKILRKTFKVVPLSTLQPLTL